MSCTDLSSKLEANPASVLGKLQKIRRQIVKPKNVFVQMATCLDKLHMMYGAKAIQVWKQFFDGLSSKDRNLGGPMELMLKGRYPIMSESYYRDPNPAVRHVIVGLPGTESCYLKQAILYENRNWELDEVAAARLMLQYLTDRMYDQIRGQGWTYGVSVSVSITEGRMRVSFSRASQLANAYKEFRAIIANYTTSSDSNSTNAEWDPVLLHSAKGSLIYNWVEIEETPEGLSSASVLAYLRQTDDSFYARRFVNRLAKVTVEDVKRVAQTYLPQFFQPEKTHTSVVCGPSEVKSMKELFMSFDPPFELKEVTDLEKSILTDQI